MYMGAISITETTVASAPVPSTGGEGQCNGVVYQVLLVAATIGFVVYLGFNAKKNVRKLWNGRSYIMIFYYALLWIAASLNLFWSTFQVWQCSPGKEVAWNLLCMLTGSAMLCLEISLVAFLLKDSYTSGLETLSRTFVVSGIIAAVDSLYRGFTFVLINFLCSTVIIFFLLGLIVHFLQATYVFGFGVQLFIETSDGALKMKWGLWIIHKLLLTAAYGYILFVHFSKWREKLPPRPAYYNYIIVMFSASAIQLFGCGLAVIGAGFGIWLYNLVVLCYHSLYLPFLYVTFLADFFQEEDFLLDNAYYAEMRDAGFFDVDWD